MITLNPLQIHPTPVMLVKVEEEEEDMVNREVMAKINQEEEEEAGDSKVVVVEEGALEVAKVKIHFLHETNSHSSYLVMFNSLKSFYKAFCFLHKNVQSSRI